MMMKFLNPYADFAIPLAWPDTTARGEEPLFLALKQIGLLKNLNFKVGHAAIILVHSKTGEACYYDFGRYVSPRGKGRARSATSDPKLALDTRCVISNGEKNIPRIANINHLIDELGSKKAATHGDGPLYFSICHGFSFLKGKQVADEFVELGSITYSAYARNSSNCSRFVESVLKAGVIPGSQESAALSFAETLKASPISNVVNAASDQKVMIYDQGLMREKHMSKKDSLLFFLRKISENFSSTAARKLPDDSIPGKHSEPEKHTDIPDAAQWLGGIGEGGWHHIYQTGTTDLMLRKYGVGGDIEFETVLEMNVSFSPNSPFEITYDTHAGKACVIQNARLIELNARYSPYLTQTKTKKIHESEYPEVQNSYG